jgi:hypothetical protein
LRRNLIAVCERRRNGEDVQSPVKQPPSKRGLC